MATSRQSERLIEAGGEDARDARVVSARMGETVGGLLYCAMPACRTWLVGYRRLQKSSARLSRFAQNRYLNCPSLATQGATEVLFMRFTFRI